MGTLGACTGPWGAPQEITNPDGSKQDCNDPRAYCNSAVDGTDPQKAFMFAKSLFPATSRLYRDSQTLLKLHRAAYENGFDAAEDIESVARGATSTHPPRRPATKVADTDAPAWESFTVGTRGTQAKQKVSGFRVFSSAPNAMPRRSPKRAPAAASTRKRGHTVALADDDDIVVPGTEKLSTRTKKPRSRGG
ncbi:hypothetical protein B0A48_05372 [Cryoendolithus antarcticus]|uniref:Uncharacterized protein n=1 Tax=Cryoendolithus antarcticus TaxID=1507870 RepID=A0A1V8TIA9_9PEZI|nr:hypothetical protein B0A48_05372 [Cryoendolithus antarcticus]